MFTLAIFCLTTSNLPWFMDLTFQVPMQYCSLQHGTLLLSPNTHNWVLFLIWHPFILPGVISPLISSSTLGTYWLVEFIFQHPIFLPFHNVHRVLKARILKWFALPFSSSLHLTEWLSSFPYVLQFKPEVCYKELMIWATVNARSCFCWLYRGSPSSAAKKIISLILVLTIWWCLV